MITLKGNSGIYEGLSTDSKPSDVEVNTEFHELDTDKTYYYDGTAWQEEPASGGGGGFTPTQTQLDAMNSGITAEDVQQIDTNKTNILLVTDHIKFDSSSKTYYLQQTQPANPAEGDIWIG